MEISKWFKRAEFECKCNCGFNAVDAELIWVLDDVREHFGKPVTVTSGCRCPEHNAKIGGAPGSKHKLGIAADIRVKDVATKDVYDYLDKKYEGKYGIGHANSFTHIDVRVDKSARWTY